jgi:hypothetical protein
LHPGVAQRRRRHPVRRVLRVPQRLWTRRLSPPRGPWSLHSGFRQQKRARSSLVGSGPCYPPKKANPKRLQNLQQRNRVPPSSPGHDRQPSRTRGRRHGGGSVRANDTLQHQLEQFLPDLRPVRGLAG